MLFKNELTLVYSFNHLTMRLFYLFFTSLFASFLLNCSSKNVATASVSSPTKSSDKSQPSENQIVYLFFTIERETSGNEIVKHTDTKITPGIIKNSSLENHENAPGNIRVTFIGKNGEELSERFVKNPLNPMMEVYTEAGVNKEKMNLQKADFSVRFNQNGDTDSVILEKITTNNVKKHLLTLKL